MSFIPVSEPVIGDRELELVNDCVKSGWVSSEGPLVKEFEAQYSDFVQTRFSTAVCNGSAAVEVALYAAGVKAGDEVIMTSFTIISCFTAITRLGAIPILCDIEPEYWNIDTNKIEKLITKRTSAILAIHLFGHPCQMSKIVKLCKKYSLKIVEDAAQAHGAKYKGQLCGSIGHVSAFSFYANKLITTGEGGMVCTSDPDIDQRAKSYRNLCFNSAERFRHDDIGYNFRMTSMQAALGIGQLSRIDQIIEKKRELGLKYRERFKSIEGIRGQNEALWADTVYWMYCVKIDPKCGHNAKTIMDRLGKDGIGTRPFFRGLHQQPAIEKINFSFDDNNFLNTNEAYEYGFYLPSSLNLTDPQLDIICDALQRAVA